MRYIILHKRDNQSEDQAQQFSRDLARLTSVRDAQLVEYESREGQHLASLYGVVSMPAALILRSDNGAMVKMWQGELPPPGDMTVGFV